MQVEKLVLPEFQGIRTLDYLTVFCCWLVVMIFIIRIPYARVIGGRDGVIKIRLFNAQDPLILFLLIFIGFFTVWQNHAYDRGSLGVVVGPFYQKEYDEKVEKSRLSAAKNFWNQYLSSSKGSKFDVSNEVKVDLDIKDVDIIDFNSKDRSSDFTYLYRIEASIPGEPKQWQFFINTELNKRLPAVGEKIRLTLDFSPKMFQDGYIVCKDYEIQH